MNKKLINSLSFIMLLSLSSPGFSDTYDMKSDYSNDTISASKKKVDYTLKVFKKDNLVYSGNLILNNSVITPIFYLEDTGLQEKKLEVVELSDKKLIGKKQDQQGIHTKTQLRVAVHLGKNEKDMWSQFFFQEVETNANSTISAAGNSQDNTSKKVSAENAPENNKLDKEIIVAHIANKESIMAWEDYKFIINASVE